MRPRKMVLSLFVFICLFLISSCRNESPAISFAVFGDPAEFEAYQSLVEAFGQAHPDIDIELRHIPNQGEYRQRLATEFSAGQPPNVFLLNYRRFAAFVGQGGLEPLGPYLEASEIIAEGDFLPPTVESFYYENQLWCIPQNMSSLVVYYNRDLFDQAGIPYPSDDWTWNDFLQTAKILTQDRDGDGVTDQYGVGLRPNIFRLAPFVWQNGGEITDRADNPTRLTLDLPLSREAFQWFVDLQVVHQVVPDAVAESAEPSETRFLNGTLAMYFNSRRGVPTYRTIQSFSWDVAPLPRKEVSAGILHSDAYCMAANTANKEAAWTFIEFANAVEGQTTVAASGRTVPSLSAVANSQAFLDPALPPANSRVYLDTMPVIRRVPIMASWVGIEESVSREIERAFYGQVSVGEAIQAAELMAAPYFEP